MNATLGLTVVASAALLVAAAATCAAPPQETAEAIRTRRMGTLVVKAKPGEKVKVTQLRHEFWFGTALSRKMFRDATPADQRERYQKLVRENFNCAVHENALKWYSIERERQGQVSYEDADRMLAWCDKAGITMRGHCLVWCVDKFVQDWIKALDDDALRVTLQGRIRDVTTRFRGRIVEYDVNNEMLHGNYYAKRLGPDIRVKMFQWAHEGDPKALLYVNDYNILNGKSLEAYEKQIRELIDAGAPVGGIGVQGHFGQPVPAETIRKSLDRLAAFKLPIRVTEYDLNTEDEQAKARFLEEFYTTCFAHPAVEGILMWGFWEGAHWRPKAALWKTDFSPTPAAAKYRELLFDKWWTRWEGAADDKGECRVPAFFGRHRVEAAGMTKEVALTKTAGTAEVSLLAPGR